ncbi:hypothetical protein ACIGCK_04940 [Microbacterium sp. NPDC078428]|uniref:hypothetical protein n=1 Tax=Microbacterium sp. NPDC078428 TaxID=3364190 RepID=UPI0037C662BA
MIRAAAPAPRWKVGDAVNVGRIRWLVRTVVDDRVELEAGNTPTGLWWRTTVDRLPAKARA